MWERRIKFLQELIDSPVEVLGSIWPCLLFMLIITGVPVWLAKKKFSERENLKWKIWFISLPLFCIVLFIFGFCGKKADNFTFENVLGWLGVSILGWLLVMTPVVFLSSKCVVSPGEADDNAGELFEMALKIGKEKREGKKTSELQAEYEQKVKNFEENGLGRTSVTYHVEVFRRQMDAREETSVFTTDITFVRVDKNGAKMPIES